MRSEESRIQFVRALLTRSGMYPSHLDIMLNIPDVRTAYLHAFTHPESDAEHNYEMFEFIGDSVLNHSIVKYIYSRYPSENPQYVQVLARLKIFMASKNFLFRVAEALGFRPFIIAPDEILDRNVRATMEDVFEATLGCTYTMANRYVMPHSGDAVVYAILESVFDTIHLPDSYEALVDAVTRLKELQDTFKSLVYSTQWTYDATNRTHKVVVTYKQHTRSFVAHKKTDANQDASKYILGLLRADGVRKDHDVDVYGILRKRVGEGVRRHV